MYTMSFFNGFTNQFARATVRSARGWSFIGALIKLDSSARQSRHVEDLPDYLLNDIGLTRADLKRGRKW